MEMLKRYPVANEQLNAIAELIGDEARNTIEAALRASGGEPMRGEQLRDIEARFEPYEWSSLPKKYHWIFVSDPPHEDQDAEELAGVTPKVRQAISNDRLRAAVLVFRYRSLVSRLDVVALIKQQPTLPTQILKEVIQCLGHQDSFVRMSAAEILENQLALPKELFETIAIHLESKDESVRRTVVQALNSETVLPDAILMALIARLEDESHDVKSMVVRTLITH